MDEMAQPILVHYKLLYSTPALFTKEQSEIHSMPISLVGFCFSDHRFRQLSNISGKNGGNPATNQWVKKTKKIKANRNWENKNIFFQTF